MIRIAVWSDLHLEFAPFEPPAVEADVIVLAGDIGVGVEGLLWAGQAFPDKPVIYVMGNHEFYGSRVEAHWAAARRLCPGNVHLLENESVEIDGVRFLACSLWTDYALFGVASQLEAMALAGECLADHRLITVDARRPFQPRDALAMHVHSQRWLEAELNRDYAGTTVVVTHHAPHPGSVAPRYMNDLSSAAFVSDLGGLMGKAALWIHGHTHSAFDYAVEGTRVLCNPRGYPLRTGGFENPDFDGGLVVAVG